jgi:hypothetical protein
MPNLQVDWSETGENSHLSSNLALPFFLIIIGAIYDGCMLCWTFSTWLGGLGWWCSHVLPHLPAPVALMNIFPRPSHDPERMVGRVRPQTKRLASPQWLGCAGLMSLGISTPGTGSDLSCHLKLQPLQYICPVSIILPFCCQEWLLYRKAIPFAVQIWSCCYVLLGGWSKEDRHRFGLWCYVKEQCFILFSTEERILYEEYTYQFAKTYSLLKACLYHLLMCDISAWIMTPTKAFWTLHSLSIHDNITEGDNLFVLDLCFV